MRTRDLLELAKSHPCVREGGLATHLMRMHGRLHTIHPGADNGNAVNLLVLQALGIAARFEYGPEETVQFEHLLRDWKPRTGIQQARLFVFEALAALAHVAPAYLNEARGGKKEAQRASLGVLRAVIDLAMACKTSADDFYAWLQSERAVPA